MSGLNRYSLPNSRILGNYGRSNTLRSSSRNNTSLSSERSDFSLPNKISKPHTQYFSPDSKQNNLITEFDLLKANSKFPISEFKSRNSSSNNKLKGVNTDIKNINSISKDKFSERFDESKFKIFDNNKFSLNDGKIKVDSKNSKDNFYLSAIRGDLVSFKTRYNDRAFFKNKWH